MTKHADLKTLSAYGALALPLAFGGLPLYVHVPDFFATQYHVSISAMGALLLALRLVDAVQDPLLGRVFDHFAHRRLKLMQMIALGMAMSFVMLFLPLPSHPLLSMAFWMFLATTAYSSLSMNLAALGAQWGEHQQRLASRLVTSRESLTLLGLTLGVVMPTLLQRWVSPHQAFLLMGLVLASLLLLSLLGLRWWYHRVFAPLGLPSKGDSGAPEPSLLAAFKHMSASVRGFFAIYTANMLAASMPAVLVLFYIRDQLQAQAYAGAFLGVYFLAGIASMVLWTRLSESLGALKAWRLGMFLSVLTFVWAFFLRAGDVWQYAGVCLGSGLVLGADVALPFILLGEYIEGKQENDATMYFGVLAFLGKLALALASFLTLSMLDWAGFTPGAGNSTEALLSLRAMYALLPCLIKGACFVAVSKVMAKENQRILSNH